MRKLLRQKPQEILLFLLSRSIPTSFVRGIKNKIAEYNRNQEGDNELNLNDTQVRYGLLRELKASEKGKRHKRREFLFPAAIIRDFLQLLGHCWLGSFPPISPFRFLLTASQGTEEERN